MAIKTGIRSRTFHSIFITCPQGLEEILFKELKDLGYAQGQKKFCGVELNNVSITDIYRINYCSRVATRVLLPLRKFNVNHRDDLYKEASNIFWLPYIPKGATIAVDSNVSYCKNFKNSLYAAQVVKDAICDQFMQKIHKRPDVDVYNPDVQFHILIKHNQAILSIDTSGQALFKRGYRQKTVKAPMQESLAAALLLQTGYTGQTVLCDPCCGSGTFLAEALLIASRTAPGFFRKKWGFEYLPSYSKEEWQTVKEEIDSLRVSVDPQNFIAIDRDYDALEACKANLKSIVGDVASEIECHRGDFKRYAPQKKFSQLVCNPPYGKRLEEQEDLRGLYRHLGDFVKNHGVSSARAAIVTSNIEALSAVNLKQTHSIELYNGGLETTFAEYSSS